MAEAAKARERVKEAAEKSAAFIETNMANVSQSLVTDDDDDGFPFGGAIGSAKKTPPRTPSGTVRSGLRRDEASGSASQPRTPIGPSATDASEPGIFVPASSAMKLRFFDAADIAGVVKAHLEEKMALAEEHERVWMALEKVVEGGREDARRRVAMLLPADVAAAARRARETEDGANRVALSSALAELDRLRDALRDAQALAERHAATFRCPSDLASRSRCK